MNTFQEQALKDFIEKHKVIGNVYDNPEMLEVEK